MEKKKRDVESSVKRKRSYFLCNDEENATESNESESEREREKVDI